MTTADELTFSILCATHNQVEFLADMLESVAAQTRDDYELVIVDDGSTDGTRDFLVEWQRSTASPSPDRVTVLHTAQGGQSAAYEAGFAHTRGEWICLLDSDDTFLPHKLETIAQAVEGHSEVGMVQHPLLVVDVHGSPTGDLRPQAATLSNGDLRDHMALDARHVAPGASGLVFRRETFAAMTPLATKEFRFAADAYLSFGAVALAPVLALPHPLARYRMQPGGQYVKRMLSADGLLLQVAFQDAVAAHFGLTEAAQRNSFFCRNVYAAKRYNGQPGSRVALARLLKATAHDRHFSARRKVGLMAVWCIMALLPRPLFVRAWRAFQMRQTGWRRILNRRTLHS